MAHATRRSRILARSLLVTLAVLGTAWLSTVDYAAKISTNVADLLPADERDPDLQLLRSLLNEHQARIVLAVLSSGNGGRPAEAAVDTFVGSLADDPAFAVAMRADDEAGQRELGRFLFERRLHYLLPDWLARESATFAASGQPQDQWPGWLAERVVTRLETFVAQPESAAFDELVTADPLLLVPPLAEQASQLAPAENATGARALIWAQSRKSPLEPEGQQPVFAAVQTAFERARAVDAGLSLEWTGVGRFAAASKARIRAELSWLNGAAIGAVLAATCLLMRRPWRAFHLLPAVGLSLMGAWVGVTAVFPRVHIVVLVLGALLGGAAVDYGFHLGVHATRDGCLGRVLKPLLASCLTTVLGFAILGFSDLPVLRHLGVFVCTGLVIALVSALLYFVQLRASAIEPRAWPAWGAPRLVRVGAAAAAAFAAVGVVRVSWRDDVRLLEVPAPTLQQNDQAVRTQFGEGSNRTAYLIRGDTLASARARAHRFQAWHAAQFPDQPLLGPGLLLPDPDALTATPTELERLEGFPRALALRLEEQGFVAESFAPFFQAWRHLRRDGFPSHDSLVSDLRGHLRGPLAQAWGEAAGQAWLLAFANHPPGTAPPADLHATELSQLRTLNQLFARYRLQAARLSAIGLLILGVGVVAAYGLRRGLQVFLVPGGAVIVTFGVLGWFGGPLNLFHLLGAFLGVCLSHDYAIFAAEVRGPGEPTPASIRLSALTTAASFGVLAFSRVPVISALGISVTLMVLVALLTVELSPPAPASPAR